jgi:hypothetical protein
MVDIFVTRSRWNSVSRIARTRAFALMMAIAGFSFALVVALNSSIDG